MWLKNNWRNLILITLAIMFPFSIFFVSLKIYFDLGLPTASLWVNAPNHPEGETRNDNEYLSSFFGSPLINYVVYKQESGTPKGVEGNEMSFYGDLDKMQNFINDDTTLNLWENDSDYVQFVVKTNDIDLTSLQINISSPTNSDIQFQYGWNTLVYAQNGEKLPDGGKFWTAERITQNHVLSNVKTNFVYTCWVKVISNSEVSGNDYDGATLTLGAYRGDEKVWEQTNDIKINLIDNDFTMADNIAKNPAGINFFNNDQWMLNYYLKDDEKTRDEILSSDDTYDSYLKWAWDEEDGYLTQFWNKMSELNMNNYTSFIGNISTGSNEKIDIDHDGLIQESELNRYTTVDFGTNDPSMMTWHVKKVNGEEQAFLPEYEKNAYLYNLKNVLKSGVKNIFLRGFSEVKYYETENSDGYYTSKLPNYVYNEDTQTMESVEMSLNSNPRKKYFGLSSEQWNEKYLTWFYDNVFQNPEFDLEGINVYLYFDEVKEFEMKAYSDLLNSMPADNDKTMRDYFKIGWCGVSMYSEFSSDLDDVDLVYINSSSLDEFKNKTMLANFIEKRKENHQLTGEYSLWDANYNLGASNPGQTAYRVLWGAAVDTPGYMRYAMTSWYGTSSWTTNDQLNGNANIWAGDTIYVFPSDEPDKYVATSTRIEMASYGYNLMLKLDALGLNNKDEIFWSAFCNLVAGVDVIEDDFSDFQVLTDDEVESRLDSIANIKGNPTKSAFINYVIKQFNKVKISPLCAIKLVYSIVNN
jgi:hypothetical protein